MYSTYYNWWFKFQVYVFLLQIIIYSVYIQIYTFVITQTIMSSNICECLLKFGHHCIKIKIPTNARNEIDVKAEPKSKIPRTKCSCSWNLCVLGIGAKVIIVHLTHRQGTHAYISTANTVQYGYLINSYVKCEREKKMWRLSFISCIISTLSQRYIACVVFFDVAAIQCSIIFCCCRHRSSNLYNNTQSTYRLRLSLTRERKEA